jgi:hypothetical protein
MSEETRRGQASIDAPKYLKCRQQMKLSVQSVIGATEIFLNISIIWDITIAIRRIDIRNAPYHRLQCASPSGLLRICPGLIAERVRAALKETRVVLISEPRQSGKTTLATAHADPAGFVRGPQHAAVGEMQRAPQLLLAIRRASSDRSAYMRGDQPTSQALPPRSD